MLNCFINFKYLFLIQKFMKYIKVLILQYLFIIEHYQFIIDFFHLIEFKIY